MHITRTDIGWIESCAIDGCQLRPHRRVIQQVLLHPTDEIVRHGFHLNAASNCIDETCLGVGETLIDDCFLAACDRIQQTEGRSILRLPRNLHSTKNRRIVRTVDEIAVVGQIEA